MDTGSEVCFKPMCPLSTLHHLLFFGHTFATCIRMPLPRIIWKVTSFPDKRFSPWQWPYSRDTGSEVCFNPRCLLSTLHHLLFFGHTFATYIRMPLPRIIWKVTAFPDMRFAPWQWRYSMDTGSEVFFNPRCSHSTLHHLLCLGHIFAACIWMPLPRIIWKVTSFPDMWFSP